MELVTIQDIFDLRYVRFNVGGYLNATTKDTIMRFPESVIAKMISPEFDKRQTNQQYIYIDRDGKHFGTILDYMRDASSVDLSRFGVNDLEELASAADYYNLKSLFEITSSRLKNPSRICKLRSMKYVLDDVRLVETIRANEKLSILLREPHLGELVVGIGGWNKIWDLIYHDDIDIYLLSDACSRLLSNSSHVYAGLYCPRTMGLIGIVTSSMFTGSRKILRDLYELILSARTHFAEKCPNEEIIAGTQWYERKLEISATIFLCAVASYLYTKRLK